MSDQQPVAVEHQVLDELMRQLGDADGTVRDQLIEDYLRSSTREVEALTAAARQSAGSTLRSVAHSLRSSSGLLGARRLAALLQELETTSVARPDGCSPLVLQIRAEHQRVIRSFPPRNARYG